MEAFLLKTITLSALKSTCHMEEIDCANKDLVQSL